MYIYILTILSYYGPGSILVPYGVWERWWFDQSLSYIHIFIHTDIYLSYMHTFIHTYIYFYIHPCIHASTHPSIHPSIHSKVRCTRKNLSKC